MHRFIEGKGIRNFNASEKDGVMILSSPSEKTLVKILSEQDNFENHIPYNKKT